MNATWLHTLWTIIALGLFLGIVIWAWSARRKQDFDALAHLPLEDDRPDSRSCA